MSSSSIPFPERAAAIIQRCTTPDLASKIHHNPSYPTDKKRKIVIKDFLREGDYGVSSLQRKLKPARFLKKEDDIEGYLKRELGLTAPERNVVMRLLRLFSYHGKVYPKSEDVVEGFGEQMEMSFEPWRPKPKRLNRGCSHATFWRTINLMEKAGLIEVINRFIVRPEKQQISNLYIMDALVAKIIKFLDAIDRYWQDLAKETRRMLEPVDRYWQDVYRDYKAAGFL